jgi:hypothetical protein
MKIRKEVKSMEVLYSQSGHRKTALGKAYKVRIWVTALVVPSIGDVESGVETLENELRKEIMSMLGHIKSERRE